MPLATPSVTNEVDGLVVKKLSKEECLNEELQDHGCARFISLACLLCLSDGKRAPRGPHLDWARRGRKAGFRFRVGEAWLERLLQCSGRLKLTCGKDRRYAAAQCRAVLRCEHEFLVVRSAQMACE